MLFLSLHLPPPWHGMRQMGAWGGCAQFCCTGVLRMFKHLSQEEKNTLTSEFAYQDKRSGMIGGYCEAGYPLYYVNEEMAAMMGYDSVEELAGAIGGLVVNTIHPEDLPRVEKDLGTQFYEGMTYETTYRMPRKDGSWFWTVDRGKVVRAEDGRLAMLSVCTDMSVLVQRQKELEARDAQSDQLFRSLPGGYVRCSLEEGLPFLYISERFLRILGWTEEEIREKFDNKFINLVYPEDRDTVRNYAARVLVAEESGGFADEIYRLQSRDGFRWVSDATVQVTASGRPIFQCIISDVSRFIQEREQREQELERLLHEAEERYEIIRALGAVYQELSVADLKAGTYTVVTGYGKSKPMQGVTGPLREFQEMVPRRILAPEQQEEAWEFFDFSTIADRLADKEYVAREFKGRNGSWYLVTLIAKNRDAAGRATHILISARNVDEQKARELAYQKDLEQAVIEARRAGEAKSSFLSRMSHDIRTPINAIVGLLKINETHFDDRALVQANQEKMLVSADHLLSLINDVLQMSKLEDGSVELAHEPIRLVELTQDIVTIVIDRATEAGIFWDYERGKTNIPYPYIYGSPVHLRQIFLNIYGNCTKYTPPGGRITTVVEALEAKDGYCAYRWTISDTGVGMSQEFLKHIFEPFAQEKHDARSDYHGTGLGMAIVKSLIEKMNGTIEITSREGVGSTFVITIPFEIAQLPDEPAAPAPAAGSVAGLRLLLAEDNELNAEIAQVLLTDAGAEVTVVHNGRQAVELFSASPAGRFDAVLMDIMMPELDGLSATRAIRALDRADARSVPIIAMMANAFDEDAKRCLAAGMSAHLAKPLEVVSVIARCCEKGPKD